MFRSYFKTAWRNITRHKGFTAINIFGLSIGICACLTIWLISSFEFSYDRFHPDKDRIFRVVAGQTDNQGKTDAIGFVPNPLPLTLRKELTGFETVAQFHNYYARVIIPNNNGEPKRFDAAIR